MAPATGYTPLSVLEDSPGSSLPPSHLKYAYGLRKRELVIGDVFQQIHKIFRKTRVIVDQNSFHPFIFNQLLDSLLISCGVVEYLKHRASWIFKVPQEIDLGAIGRRKNRVCACVLSKQRNRLVILLRHLGRYAQSASTWQRQLRRLLVGRVVPS